ncbi:MAG: hypothetical protein ACPGFA_10965 [Pikeienuella sp.]
MIVFGLLSAIVAVISTAGNAAEIAISNGEQRAQHITMVVLVILALLAFGMGWPALPTRIVGFLLTITALSMSIRHVGRERLCCFAQMSLGMVALMGLPFSAA